MTAIAEASRCAGPRLPFGPLEQLLRQLLVDEMANGRLVGASVRAQAMRLGVTPRQVLRWRHQGLSWVLADLLAVRAGFHPGEVWGGQWWALEEDEVKYTQATTTSGGAHG